MLFLKDVLRDMRQSDQPFRLEAWTADLKAGTGGELRIFENARLLRKVAADRAANPSNDATPAVRHSKHPHHDHNQTINIEEQPSGHVRKVHIRLIERYNGHHPILW